MELYLDSVDLKEIEEAFKLGFLTGLTTTPTFMHRSGIKDIDGTILKLAEIVPILQVEALGETTDEIYKEAHRLLDLGLSKDKTVFKTPISLDSVKACKKLVDEGIMVNIHLVYTLQQAYMAMAAGAHYVCPLVGRLQDEGHDAIALVEQCIDAVNYYGYNTKIMFSSVRHPEHVRNAVNIGVHTCTIPWKVMKQLTENNFTRIGTKEFLVHTRLMTMKVRDVIGKENPVVNLDDEVINALMEMTESGFGAVSIIDENKNVIGIFTDGDLRRYLQEDGKSILNKKMREFKFKKPLTLNADDLIIDAVEVFKKYEIDNIIVKDNGKTVGMIDIQDLIKLDLFG